MSVSPVAQKLADRISPSLQEAARDHEDDFVALGNNMIERLAARSAYPVAVRAIPTGAAVGTDKLLSHFGAMSVSEIAMMLAEHAQHTGAEIHPSHYAMLPPRTGTSFT